MRPQKKCSRCGFEGDALAFFRKNPDFRRARIHARAVCIGCEVTSRNKPDESARWRRKACATISHHARKFGIPSPELQAKFGWDVGQMAHDAEHAHGNGCHYCSVPFSSMGNGMADISLDIIDRDRQPFYRTNTRWACLTCNRQKSTLPPEIFALRQIEWKRFLAYKEKAEVNPYFGLPLLQVLGVG